MLLCWNGVVSEWRCVGMALCWNGVMLCVVLVNGKMSGVKQSDDPGRYKRTVSEPISAICLFAI